MVKWVSAFGLSDSNEWRWWAWLLAAYRRTHSPGRLAWSEGRRPLGAVPYSSYEPGELLQWLCYDDSTINIVVVVVIIIIIIVILISVWCIYFFAYLFFWVLLECVTVQSLTKHSCMLWAEILNTCYKNLVCCQGRRQEFAKGGQKRGSGDRSPPSGSRGRAPVRVWGRIS